MTGTLVAAGGHAQAGALVGAVATQVIVLNGGASSGKSGIARCLEAVLPDPWLVFGVDTPALDLGR
jgi:chloramphenicol 3-O-phosphotransferase